MTGTDDHLRVLLHQAAEEEAFIDRFRRNGDDAVGGESTASASPPAVSLMVTNQQRAELRGLGFSNEAIRLMTPADAHAQLGTSEPRP
jgi:hypothetical protein